MKHGANTELRSGNQGTAKEMAKNRGSRTVDGLGMLINQAVPAFEMWHNTKVKVSDALRQSALHHLERKV